MARTLMILAVLTLLSSPAAYAQDGQAPMPVVTENILMFWDGDVCRYQLLESANQDEFQAPAESWVRLVATRGAARPLHAEAFITNQGASGPDRYHLTPENPVVRFQTRPRGLGQSRHQVRINCCERLRPVPGGYRCVGPSQAYGVDDPPGDPRQNNGNGPNAGDYHESPRLPEPLLPSGPVAPGGPRMIVIDF